MSETGTTTETPSAPTDAKGAPHRQVRLRVDQRNMQTSYANAFRTSTTLDEVIVEFGLNTIQPAAPTRQGEAGDANKADVAGEMTLEINQRMVMNYQVAKRLAATLNQIVRNYEQRFGEIKPPRADAAGNTGQ